ncbi:hypothetical protein F938_00520 [Acinetobacter bereziniae LMG 1003 = CIP 70.12]|uniref:Isochorismatase-like domain-containing protein n=1 Tax=Acinetobacter bereziniae LMG 1003 = CIP 70.12 TaxID=981324 RepID=N9F837_ACIBZ|nr:isochorismatase family cysteine hydrolase [Acinetobacter bereziniae]ENW01004.1 hypothetical protein F938_00520 [Acinetobacter bereziniae LMG 1003 = CIP 70.12]MBJ9907233.1 cysteine hydrolase [Acinetobacter bereziniae]MBJ9928628.1 cysteine hydrolase [Acinetobacter bereziniae]
MKFEINNPKKTALLIIDMENDFVKPDASMWVPMATEIVPNIKSLATISREKGLTIIYTTHVHQKDRSDMGLMSDFWSPIDQQSALVDDTEGVEIYPDLAPQKDELVIKKNRYSAFYNTDLDQYLKKLGIETLIITGTVTNMCCESTARDAHFRNYKVIFVSDGTATMDHPDLGAGAMSAQAVQKATLTSLSLCVAEISSTHEVIKRLSFFR